MTERGAGKAPAATPTATRKRGAVSKNLALRYSYDAHICAWISTT